MNRLFYLTLLLQSSILVAVDVVGAAKELPKRTLRGNGNRRVESRSEIFEHQQRALLEFGTQNIARYTGDKELLVIRIEASDSSTSKSHDELVDDIFTGEKNVPGLYKACSRGKLRFVPATGSNIDRGVATVKMDEVVGRMADKGENSIVKEIEEKSETFFGRKLEDFDEIMMCMPPGTKVEAPNGQPTENFAAFVPSTKPWNYFMSIYSDNWCSSLSAGMHEIGHTLGLNHANFNNIEYNDKSGMMGFSKGPNIHGYNEYPMKCFNPAKSWQLGWYAEQSKRIDPFVDAPFSTILTGITRDPDDNDPSRTILLQIPNGSTSLYIGYNLAHDHNSDTEEEFRNKVLIDEQDFGGVGDIEAGRILPMSNLLGYLDAHESYVVENYAGSGHNLVIRTQHKIQKGDVDEIPVEIFFESSDLLLGQQKCNPNEARFETVFVTPSYAKETAGWTLKDSSTGKLVVDHDKMETEDLSFYSKAECIAREKDYTFTIFNENGSGLCCDYGFGSYSVFVDGEELFRGGEFGFGAFGKGRNNEVSHTFYVEKAKPTPAPTPFPTMGPSRTPTFNSPTALCIDDSSFRYKGIEQWDCDWVAKQPSKRCDKEKDGMTVKDFCPQTCNSCDGVSSVSPVPAPTMPPDTVCADNTDFRWRDNAKWDCDWVSKEPDSRCDKEADGISVRDECKKTCNACNNSPPTSPPTKNENVFCEDDPNFEWKSNPKKNCKWVGRDKDNRCKKKAKINGKKVKVRNVCKKTCGSCKGP